MIATQHLKKLCAPEEVETTTLNDVTKSLCSGRYDRVVQFLLYNVQQKLAESP